MFFRPHFLFKINFLTRNLKVLNSKITKFIVATLLFSSVGFIIWQCSIPRSPVRETVEEFIWKSKYWIGKAQMYFKNTKKQEEYTGPSEISFKDHTNKTVFIQKNNLSYSKPNQRFSCDGRQYCSEMNSCAEARYFLRNCPNTKMDGDNDGKPCEDRCGH